MSQRMRFSRTFAALVAFVTIALASVWSPSPARAALDAGRPACDYCRMLFSEPGFGGEIATRHGARKIYDSVECMAAAVLTDSVPQREIRAIALVSHDAPYAHLALARAVFVHCPAIASPMGLSLVAFRTRERAARACPQPGLEVLDWRGVLAYVNATWFQGKLAVDKHLAGMRSRTDPGPAAHH